MNDHTSTLGSKIRYFRKRAKLSQFQLENEIGASAGSISRIENNEVNPTKETLQKCRLTLKLASREFRYLGGDLAQLETQKDIQSAISEVENYFSKSTVLAYLTDSRMRIHYASQGFVETLKIEKEFAVNNIYGKSLIEIATNPKLKVKDKLDPNSFEDTVFHLLTRFYNECGFMQTDQVYEQTVDYINENKLIKSLWAKAQNPTFESLNSIDARQITFKMYGHPINMKYSVESLASDNRFDVIEYVPTNRFLKLLCKL